MGGGFSAAKTSLLAAFSVNRRVGTLLSNPAWSAPALPLTCHFLSFSAHLLHEVHASSWSLTSLDSDALLNRKTLAFPFIFFFASLLPPAVLLPQPPDPPLSVQSQSLEGRSSGLVEQADRAGTGCQLGTGLAVPHPRGQQGCLQETQHSPRPSCTSRSFFIPSHLCWKLGPPTLHPKDWALTPEPPSCFDTSLTMPAISPSLALTPGAKTHHSILWSLLALGGPYEHGWTSILSSGLDSD